MTGSISAYKDYYSILNIPPTASYEEIKRAYRRIAKSTHPDKNPDHEKVFREATEAYTVLRSPASRVPYDSNRNTVHYSTKMKWSVKSDLKVTIKVSRLDMIQGASKILKLSRKCPCQSCNGTGSETKLDEPCPTCAGTGIDVVSIIFKPQKACSICGGSGKIPINPLCSKCNGTRLGRETFKHIIKLNPHTNTYVYPSLGNYDISGCYGDLIIDLSIKENPFFKVSGLDVSIILDMTPSQAILGDTLSIDIFGNPTILEIEPGTNHNDVIHHKGKGIASGERTGKLTTKMNLVIPKNINEREKELYSELLRIEKERVHGWNRSTVIKD